MLRGERRLLIKRHIWRVGPRLGHRGGLGNNRCAWLGWRRLRRLRIVLRQLLLTQDAHVRDCAVFSWSSAWVPTIVAFCGQAGPTRLPGRACLQPFDCKGALAHA